MPKHIRPRKNLRTQEAKNVLADLLRRAQRRPLSNIEMRRLIQVRQALRRRARPAMNPGRPTVYQTILAQLGGNRFIAMTGANHFVGSSNSLTFKLPLGKMRWVRIELTPHDLYDVVFFNAKAKAVKEVQDVYAEQLKGVIESVTGLRVSLNPRGGNITRREWIEKRASEAGLTLEVSHPGDGITRFHFYEGGRHIFTAKGAKQAEKFIAEKRTRTAINPRRPKQVFDVIHSGGQTTRFFKRSEAQRFVKRHPEGILDAHRIGQRHGPVVSRAKSNPRLARTLTPQGFTSGSHRGYSIRSNHNGEYWIEKDGHLIQWVKDVADGRRVIDAMLGAAPQGGGSGGLFPEGSTIVVFAPGAAPPMLGQTAAEAAAILGRGRRPELLREAKQFDETRLVRSPLFGGRGGPQGVFENPAPTLSQAVDARLQDMREVFQSGVTEQTGRGIRAGGSGPGSRDYVGRIGCAKPAFPELRYEKAGPQAIAAAIQRGGGVVYDRVRSMVERDLSNLEWAPERKKRSPGRPTVAPHPPVRRYCQKCRAFHTKSQHRFHGAGSFHRTHLFAFNPRRQRIGRARKVFYDREIGTDPGPYKHDFKAPGPPMYRTADNKILIGY